MASTLDKTMPPRRRKSLAALSIAALSANAGLVSGFQAVNSRHGMPPKSYAGQHCGGKQNPCPAIIGEGQHQSFALPPTASALHISTPSASSIDGGEADINSSGATGSDISHHQQGQHQALDIATTSAASDGGTKDNKKKPTKKKKVQHAQNEITSADKAVLWTAVAGIVAAFAAVTQVSGPGAWKYYVAGGICAAFSHGITTPIDVVKVC